MLMVPETPMKRAEERRVNNEELLDKADEYEIEECAEYVADESDVGERIDKYLATCSGLTRSAVAKLVDDGRATVNGKAVEKNYKLRSGDVTRVLFPPIADLEAKPQNIPLDIIYEDDDIIVINKPSGMVVHPAAGNPDGTLVNALLYHCGDSLSGIGGVARPGIVHRIDKDTSGLLVVAKNDKAHLSLTGQLKDHSVYRAYYAVVCGNIPNEGGTINAPIGRNPNDRKKMAIIKDTSCKSAKNAVTHYSVLERFRGCTLVRCVLETGRTHQIRVHMAGIGHPILGDPVYGGDGSKLAQNNRALLKGQCLHAKELWLTHPVTGEKMHFECEIPEYTEKLLQKLRMIE